MLEIDLKAAEISFRLSLCRSLLREQVGFFLRGYKTLFIWKCYVGGVDVAACEAEAFCQTGVIRTSNHDLLLCVYEIKKTNTTPVEAHRGGTVLAKAAERPSQPNNTLRL